MYADKHAVLWHETKAGFLLRGSTSRRRALPVSAGLGPAPWYEWVQSLEVFDTQTLEGDDVEQSTTVGGSAVEHSLTEDK